MTMDNLTGLLGTVIVAGVALKVADRMFPAQETSAPRRATRRGKAKRRTRVMQGHPGNFSNLF